MEAYSALNILHNILCLNIDPESDMTVYRALQQKILTKPTRLLRLCSIQFHAWLGNGYVHFMLNDPPKPVECTMYGVIEMELEHRVNVLVFQSSSQPYTLV